MQLFAKLGYSSIQPHCNIARADEHHSGIVFCYCNSLFSPFFFWNPDFETLLDIRKFALSQPMKCRSTRKMFAYQDGNFEEKCALS